MTARNLVTLGRPLGASLLLAGLLLAGLGAGAASWADLSAVTEERDAKADLLARGVAVSRRAEAARAAPTADPFVKGDSATLAAAEVDADLRALAASSGMSLLSSRAEAKPDDPGGAGRPDGSAGSAGGSGLGTRIEEQAVVEGQNEALQAMLAALETGLPTMLVDDLAVEPAAAPDAVPGSPGIVPQAPRLHASLTLSAYWRPGKPQPR